MTKGTPIAQLEKRGNQYLYRGHLWTLNKPIPSSRKDKKMMVLASKIIDGKKRVKLIHFGAKGYGHNYSEKAKKSYLKRSSQIRNKAGELTKNDKWSANYWARKILWPKGKPATGSQKTRKAA